nr:hypothetical protein [Tanacetum cinerariifolium]
MVFNENVMYKDTLKDSSTDAYKSFEELQVDVEQQRDEFSKEEQDIGVSRSSIWVKVALTACKDYELEQLDVKTTFLHGNLKEVTYMRSYALGKSKAEIGSTKSLPKKQFGMKDLGKAKKVLDNEKSIKMSLGGNFKLSMKDFSVRDYVVERTSKVLYTNTVGILIYLMVCTRPDIAYAATLQHVVALSTIEAEYMALTEAMNEVIWLRGLLEELGVELNTVAINCENQDAIHLSWNHVFHKKTKHINVRYHFIREVLEAKMVKVLNVGNRHNVADALTNVVPELKLQHFLELLYVGVG